MVSFLSWQSLHCKLAFIGVDMLKDLVLKSRSYRRFYGDEEIATETLLDLIELARNCPSSANMQPLKFKIVNEPEENEKLFACLHWAGALPEWGGPKDGERPSAYIVILSDLSIAKNKLTDVGIVAQTMMLGAVEQGYGGCMLGAIERPKILELFNLSPEEFYVELVLALGKPKEDVRLVPIKENGSTKYYRDQNQVHYVPKRSLEEILLP